MDKLTQFCKEHKWTVILVACGLLAAILFITIGFWRTLLLVFLVGVAFIIGVLLDRNGTDGVKAFINNLFSKGHKDA